MQCKKLLSRYFCSLVVTMLGVSPAFPGDDRAALIDPHWVLSTGDRVRSCIRIGDQDHPTARSVNFGDVRLIRLINPVFGSSIVTRCYDPDFSEISSLSGVSSKSLLYRDSLLGFKNGVGECVALDNDLINSEIIRDALSEDSSPFLQLPYELHEYTMRVGRTAKGWRGVNKNLTKLANGHVQINLGSIDHLRRYVEYLKENKVADWCVDKVTLHDYRGDRTDFINRGELSAFVNANPMITHLTITNYWGGIQDIAIEDLSILSKLSTLTKLDANVWLGSRADLDKFVEKRSFSVSGIKINPSYSDFSDEDLQRLLGANSELKLLHLGVSHVSDAGLRNLPRCLTVLEICGLHITDGCLRHLPKGLIELDLCQCKEITDTGLQHLTDMPLIELNLSGCEKITDGALGFLPKTLAELVLSMCTQLTDDGLKHLQDMPLSALYLGDCLGITDKGLKYLPTTLKRLTLPEGDRITDTGIEEIKSRIPGLDAYRAISEFGN